MTTSFCSNSFSDDSTNILLPSDLRPVLDAYCLSKRVLANVDMEPEVRELQDMLNANFEEAASNTLIKINDVHIEALESLIEMMVTGNGLDAYKNAQDEITHYATALSESAAKITNQNYRIAKNLCHESGTCDDNLVGEISTALDNVIDIDNAF